MAFAFEKRIVCQKVVTLADQVLAATERFPRGYAFLSDQLNRTSVSIAANLAEGNGRFTIPDRRHFFGIARGSIQECVPLLDLALRRGLLRRDSHDELRKRLEEVGKMISGLINGLGKREACHSPQHGETAANRAVRDREVPSRVRRHAFQADRGRGGQGELTGSSE